MRKLVPLMILTALFLLTSCLYVAALDDDTDTYVEIYPKETNWITNDLTTVYITLDANATTGYEWEASIDGVSVAQTYENYTAPDYSSTGLVGVPGIWTAHFETTGYDGTSYVTLRYVRPWDMSDVAYTITFRVTAAYGMISDVTVMN